MTGPIIRFEEDKELVWRDAQSISGRGIEETCERCESEIAYGDEFDAEFCPVCNIWLEGCCIDPFFAFCAKRPKTPFPEVISMK